MRPGAIRRMASGRCGPVNCGGGAAGGSPALRWGEDRTCARGFQPCGAAVLLVGHAASGIEGLLHPLLNWFERQGAFACPR